ncbi:MAG TPA: cytochrome c oxidase subunit II [Candidatus Baltobacteraceae bacterium]|nr:cytochrome c oxidase subunit II [Candidatus Baltobacteraceae bacterium]
MPVFDPASAQGNVLGGVWLIFIAGALFVAAFVYGLLIYALAKWRKRGEGIPPQFKTNTFWEITGVIIPLLMVGGLFAVTLLGEYRVDAVENKPYAVVDAGAFRWSWQFKYAGSGITVDGTPDSPPTLVLAVGKTTQIDLHSADVVHAFWIPAFLFKRDATPGYTQHFDVTPTRTGTFEGKCVEFCGLDHARMTFSVRVVSQAAYDRWVSSGGTAAL